jgi:hypothetical protein
MEDLTVRECPGSNEAKAERSNEKNFQSLMHHGVVKHGWVVVGIVHHHTLYNKHDCETDSTQYEHEWDNTSPSKSYKNVDKDVGVFVRDMEFRSHVFVVKHCHSGGLCSHHIVWETFALIEDSSSTSAKRFSRELNKREADLNSIDLHHKANHILEPIRYKVCVDTTEKPVQKLAVHVTHVKRCPEGKDS